MTNETPKYNILNFQHWDINSYKVLYEDFYIDRFNMNVYEVIRIKENLKEYKIVIVRGEGIHFSRPHGDTFAYFYYQTMGNGFKLWHKFRVTDEIPDPSVSIDVYRNVAEKILSLYLGKCK